MKPFSSHQSISNHNLPVTSQIFSPRSQANNSTSSLDDSIQPPSFDQAQELIHASNDNLVRRQVQADSHNKAESCEYIFLKLINLPTEIQYNIFSNLNQKNLERFFLSIEKYILLGLAKISSQQLFSENEKNCIQLLETALSSFSQPLYCNTIVCKILKCAQKLGFKKLFEQSPLLSIDFNSPLPDAFSYAALKAILKGSICCVKTVVLKNLKEEAIIFYTKYFPKLENMLIHTSDTLKTFELNDPENQIKKIEFVTCQQLQTVDIQDAFQLETFTCIDAANLENIKICQDSSIQSFKLVACSLDKIHLEYLADSLKKSCNNLDLMACIVGNIQYLSDFISSLRNLQILNLYNIPIVNLNFLRELTHLEKIDLSCGFNKLNLNLPLNLSNLRELKDINLSGRIINDLSFLIPLQSLEQINLAYVNLYNEEIVQILGSLPNLKLLDLSANNQITNLSFLSSLSQLEGLNIDACDGITPDELMGLSGLPKLKKLALGSNEQTRDLSFLQALVHIEELVLGNYPDLEEGSWNILESLSKLKKLNLSLNEDLLPTSLNFLKKCHSLVDLDLGWYGHSSDPKVCETLKDLRQLQKLNLENTDIQDLSFLNSLNFLQELNLSGCADVPADGFLYLKNLRQLQKLNLENTDIQDLSFLKSLSFLQELNITNCKFLDESKIKLFMSHMPGCNIIKDTLKVSN